MGTTKPQPVKTPFQQTNTYGSQSIAQTPEAQSFLSTPLDFGDPTNVDPGVGRRTDLAEQEATNRSESAFNAGVPRFLRERALASEQRGIRSQGAAEAQQAQFMNQQGNNARRGMVTQAELARRERVLPQFFQTGSSGFGTQVVQPQPGFWQRAGLSLIGGARDAASMFAGGMG